MKQRAFISVLVAIVLVGCVALRMVHIVFVDMLAVFIMYAAGLEMAKGLEKKFAPPYIFAVCFFPVLALGVFYFGETIAAVGGQTFVVISVFLIFFALLISKLFSKNITNERIYSTMFVILYPMTLASLMLSINRMSATGSLPFNASPYGATPIILLLLTSTFSDMFAYLIGSTFKGPKLAPKISPKKTVSGAIGGLFGGILGALICVLVSNFNVFGTQIITPRRGAQVAIVFIAGVFGSIFTQAGDLLASAVKRKLEVKDYGRMLGSHGGVMDRVDGQIVNMVFIYLFFTILTEILV